MTPEKTVVADVLSAARKLMNNTGAHWTKGSWRTVLDNGESAFCSVGALRQVTGYVSGGGVEYSEELQAAARFLAQDEEVASIITKNYGGEDVDPIDGVITWNDDAGTTWQEIEAVFTRVENRLRESN